MMLGVIFDDGFGLLIVIWHVPIRFIFELRYLRAMIRNRLLGVIIFEL